MQHPTQYLALFNLQKYIHNNVQVLNNVNISKANGILARHPIPITRIAKSSPPPMIEMLK
jgi:hypothetical protein